MKSPSRFDCVFPAEWEGHEATWLGWPHNTNDWPGKFPPIPWVFGEMTRRLAPGEKVRIIVKDAAHEASARRVLDKAHADPSQVEFFRIPTNRGWTRDFGPLFVRDAKGGKLILDHQFNAWAKYPDWRLDNAVRGKIAKKMKRRLLRVDHRGRQVVLEGGAIDVNGRGSLLTTEECLLDQETQCRNPGFSRNDMNAVFAKYFGAPHVLWLGRGITGDDTHGHVDDLARFVNPTTIVLVQENNTKDENYRVLAENRERARGFRLEDGSKLNVVELPMPQPLYFEGRRIPASYANFYIGNAAVLVPTFNDPHDRVALGVLAELITDRPVIGIHAVDLVWGFGTIHCLTQQEPA
jgi:agmatine deiminase